MFLSLYSFANLQDHELTTKQKSFLNLIDSSDSNVKCELYALIGWLEPLLDRIAEDKSIVVCPVIDVIEDDSFKYQYGNARATSIGGFDWNMQFNWHAIPEYERKRRDFKDYLPVRYLSLCCTMSGLPLVSVLFLYHRHRC